MKTWFITAEERQALKRAIKLLELKPGTLFLACFLGAAGLGASIALGATAAWLIARASQMPPVLYLEVAVVSVRLFGISKAVFRYLERLASHQLGVSGMTTLRTNLYKTLSHSDTARIASLRRGDILDRLGTDVDNIGDFVVKSLLPAMVATIVGIITVIGISLVDWRAGLFLTLGLLLSGVVGPLFTIRSTRIAQRRETESRAHISEVAMTIVDGSAQITVDGQTQQVLAGLSDLEDQLYDAKDATAKPAAWAAAIDVFGMLMSVIMAAYFGIFAVIDQSIPEVMLAVLALTPLASFEGTAQLGPAAQQLVISATSAVRIMNMLPPEDQVKAAEETEDAVIENFKATGPSILEAKDLAIGWPGGPVVADGINLRLAPGDHLAIVGQSGIGKTTLLYTLSGLLKPVSGSVKIDGVDISSLPRTQAAASFVITPEDAHIFETTILENLRVANGQLSVSEGEELVKEAGLGEWLSSLPDGIETELGSGATTISGGERRRILLARALAAKAPLLALDEPGEHLDPETADALLRDLLTAGSKEHQRGVVLVTHRLTPLDQADRVFIMDKPHGLPDEPATFVAQGTHRELLETHQGYAWSLRQEQVDVF
ncbi:thiol reductant ABC exporter subunit CydC [Varibaculum prostatecancerukia]|uniref:thiol reductant ABC exporter subunit CydC n=1 Tax=Varibaculum prostatecancerukia TaxID=2811781 RepID=UPI001BFFF7D3|nr:thiol reductant ABC exporter subunit CydC [Varibaculum prostatecancerukia]